MKSRFLFAQLITVSSLIFCSAFFGNEAEPDRVKIAAEITDKTAKKICQEKNLVLVGTGGGMLHGVQMKAMSFYYYNEVDIKTARRLLVYCTQEYLRAINSDKRIRPFLVNYPFTEKDVEIRIFFFGSDRRDLPVGKISVASVINGKVRYKTDSTVNFASDILQEEPYEEARKIVAAEDSGLRHE